MNASTKQTIETVFQAIISSEQIVSTIAEFTGLDSLKIVSASKELLPTLSDPGPDEAAAYDEARAEAETKSVRRTGLDGT